jgi:hypothetical protein
LTFGRSPPVISFRGTPSNRAAQEPDMFVVERKGIRLKRSFYIWAILFLCLGPLFWTMHIHLAPRKERDGDRG